MAEDKKKFLLRLDQDLYDHLSETAQQKNRSINAHIEHILEESVKGKSFEQRQITGQVVNGKDIDQNTGLVQVRGIYYRYLTSDNSLAKETAQYAIVDAVGNILTLRKI